MSTTSIDVTPFAATLDALASRLPPRLQKPRVGIVCGSGLSTLARSMREAVHVPYSDLPGFSTSTVQGHQSSLAFGLLGPGEGVPVVAMLGRFHPYEGHPLRSVVYPIRVLAKLGVKELIITNASGALNPTYAVGSIVTIADHVALPNLTGPLNALFGPTLSPDYSRFLPLSDAYSTRMRRAAFRASVEMLKAGEWGAAEQDDEIPVQEGIYAYVSGPTYETPAEGRLLRAAGADVVGMSTVPEVLAAREEGLEVCVLSLVTNKVVTTSARVRDDVLNEIRGLAVEHKKAETVSHEEVLQVGRERAEVMRVLVERVVVQMYDDARLDRS